jgi:hypothetical protein
MRTIFVAVGLVGAGLMPLPALSSMSGSLVCSGVMNVFEGDSTNLSCSGDLSLSDAVIGDPLKVVIEASGTLTLRRLHVQAPLIELTASAIDVDRASVLSGDDIRFISGPGGDPSLPPHPVAPPPHPVDWEVFNIGDVIDRGATFVDPPQITLSNLIVREGASLRIGGRVVLINSGGVSVQGGSLVAGDGLALAGGAGLPPIFIASNVPEPAGAPLLAAGLVVVAVLRKMKMDSR